MEIDTPEEQNGGTPSTQETGLLLTPVLPEASGYGFPYAPENWPQQGDIWKWKVGKRVAGTGYFVDRYLYAPKHFRQREYSPSGRKFSFASKLSLERYIREVFPDTDVDTFFASFSWRIPAKHSALLNGDAVDCTPSTGNDELSEGLSLDNSQSDAVKCQAGNKLCNSLKLEQLESSSPVTFCNVCCSEPGFCRDCCCILCCKTVDCAHEGYSYIKCEEIVEDCTCGHVAHLECALRCHLAGTVDGSIGLDAEYYCRRCDGRTNLVSHVKKILDTCESIDSRTEVESILNLMVCLLRDSQKSSAKDLLNWIKIAISKLECGAILEDVWRVDDNIPATAAGICDLGNAELEIVKSETPLAIRTNSQVNMEKSLDHQSDLKKLEDNIEQVLQSLKRSQEFEYNLAAERLHEQKNYIHNLYQQLDSEKSELVHRTSDCDPDFLLSAIMAREDQIRRELMKLRDMENIGKGFGRISKDTLKEYFSLDIAEMIDH